jgi:hypothetical protein
MTVVVEMQNTGDSRARAEIALVIEHVLSDRPGEWRVSIIGSREHPGVAVRPKNARAESGPDNSPPACPAETARHRPWSARKQRRDRPDSGLGLQEKRHFVSLRFCFYRLIERLDLPVEHRHQPKQLFSSTTRPRLQRQLAQHLLSRFTPQLAFTLHSFIQAKVLQFVFHPAPESGPVCSGATAIAADPAPLRRHFIHNAEIRCAAELRQAEEVSLRIQQQVR